MILGCPSCRRESLLTMRYLPADIKVTVKLAPTSLHLPAEKVL